MTLVILNDDAGPRLVSRVPQGDARREHVLRDLIYEHPVMLPVHELDPGFGRLFTVARELGIPGVGFVDLLLADERGRLVIVECKLWRNPQARREVIGQIIDYARALARYSYEGLQRQITVATRREGNALYAMAQEAGSPLGEAAFVDRVSRDLAAGRFLLLIVGDGITEGTRSIAEYLQDQPGLAFDFGLIEMAEYRYGEPGQEQIVVQPRLIAKTAVIERHVIRSEIAGATIEPVDVVQVDRLRPVSAIASGANAEASETWGRFVERFVADTRFDDPGQPAPRRGGVGWIRINLPANLYINAYRSRAAGAIGAQVKFDSAEALSLYRELLAQREAIDAEFSAAGLPVPEWFDAAVPNLSLVNPSPQPWDEQREAEQRAWLGRAANQFVNSLRPRLQMAERDLAA